MRILHIVSAAAPGGAEIYVRDLAIYMANKGHDVVILFIDRACESGGDKSFEDDFLSQLDAYGIGYDFIGKSSRRKPWQGVIEIKKNCHRFVPDIVHAHLYFAALFALFVPGIRLVYTHHNIRLRASRYLYKLLDFRVVHYVGICQACKIMLEKVSKRPVVRIDNGVDVSRLIPKDLVTNQGGPLILVSVGHLSDQKNFSLLIDALKYLSSQSFILKIAGDGPNKNQLKSQASSLGIEGKVEFLGNIKNVNQLLNSADIFIMSSAWEGLPIAQIEATLTGLPVVVTNVGGCAEIVHRVVNGLVVNDFDPKELARQILILMSNDLLRTALAKNALLYSEDYLINVAAEKHIGMYMEIMGIDSYVRNL